MFGSQAILVHDPDPPIELRQSIEIDLVPTKVPDRSDQIDGVLRELSQFHATHGFYVHGVGFETAVFPSGWKDRCLNVRVGNPAVTVQCPDLHDLAASKLAAGRDKDFSYVAVLVNHGYVTASTLLTRVERLPIAVDARARIGAWLARVSRDIGREH